MMLCFNKLKLDVITVIAFVFVISVTFSGCRDTYLDKMWKSNVEHEEAITSDAERIARLQSMCDTVNRNIESMSALVAALYNNDYVMSVSQSETGYRILFRKGEYVEIFNGKDGENGKDGADGASGIDGKNGEDGIDGKDGTDGRDGEDASVPTVSIKQAEDSVWYWTLDGEFITDSDGKLIPVYGDDAVAPQFRLDGVKWQISYDEGLTWYDVGQAAGINGDEFFTDIYTTDTSVTFKFSDGTSFSLPMWKGLDISLDIDGGETGVEPCKEVYINYQLNYSSETSVVTAESDGNYRVRIQKIDDRTGVVIVSSPKYYEDGHVSIIASDGSGYVVMKVVNFYKREISISNLDYTISPLGGTISIPVSANFEYVLNFQDPEVSWLKYQVKPMAVTKNDRIEFVVEMNKDFKERKAVLELYAKNDPSSPLKQINIRQTSAVWSLERNRYMLNADACNLSTTAESTSGLRITSEASWFKIISDTPDNVHYSLSIAVEANLSGARRSADIEFSTSDGENKLGEISITQIAEGEENPDNMIFRVRAYGLNKHTCVLPLSGGVNCSVDWGDGSDIEYFTSEYPSHKYSEESNEYIVKVSGVCRKLYSPSKMDPSIVEVIQWGNTGLENMNAAFENDNLLVKIPGDVSGAFSKVKNFNCMFGGCSSLKSVPEDLFVSGTSAQTLRMVFRQCDSLTSIPAGLFRNCVNVTDMAAIFERTGIVEIPEPILSNCSKLENVGSMFNNCRLLKNIPQKLFWKCPDINDIGGLFQNCVSLESLPEKLFSANSKVTSMVSTFSGCTSLKSLPSDLLAYFPDLKDFWQTFLFCSSLETLPQSLFDNNKKIQSTQEMFFCCGIGGESPYTVVDGKKIHLYERWMYPDWFYPILRPYNRAFTGNDFIDQNNMPDNWKN